ncbi:5-methylcytosine restriction system specificity protein McrC [Candidatus Avelusimicrobium fimicolum]|uniref:5-methylcytosine restriction system specificity protein McrC n=1 Tax=Candidatus Avelusimicrobium fimicolum TaxID=3416216 RepID=UPI003D12613B
MLDATPRHNTQYTIRPDILFGNDTVIDTKYKILDLPEHQPSEADIYQMLAYARFYKRPNVILCYPTFQQSYPKTVILYNEIVSLNVVTLNLNSYITHPILTQRILESFQ